MTNSVTWRYLLNGVLILQHSLPGVFSNNVYGDTVNGALWTMPIEFLCYVACYLIYKLKCMKKKRILGIFALYVFMALIGYEILSLYHLELLTNAIWPCYFFMIGVLIYVYKDKVVLDLRIFCGSFIAAWICIEMNIPYIAMGIFLPYMFVYIAFMGYQCSIGDKLGNLSYPIYLCGWPIQQFWIWYFGGNMNLYMNMCISSCCAILCGIAIYYLVEKPTVTWQKNIILKDGKNI